MPLESEYRIVEALQKKGWKYEPIGKESFDYENNAMVDPLTGKRFDHHEALKIQNERDAAKSY